MLALLALASQAYIPNASRIANAVAERNVAAGRQVPVALDVELRIGDREAAAATGVLESDPSGFARLELRSATGFVERHLRRGRQLAAARDGAAVPEPRPFLPPWYLLQAPSAGQLQGWLVELGAAPAEIALGYQGDADCFVLGGRDPGASERTGRPSLWVEEASLEPVRLDLPGVSYRFGPPARFGELQVPSSVEIRVAGAPPARLRVLDARPTAAPPGGFSPDWLRAAP